MATATRRSRAAGQVGRRAEGVDVPEAAKSVSVQGNGERSLNPRAYECPECGHVLRVSGVGRHRVYFERDEERSVDPVMDGACPGCGRGLPGKNPVRARS